DGIDKAARGLTTLEEVLRVVSRADGVDRAAEAAPAGEQKTARADSGDPDPAPVHGKVLVVEDSSTISSVVKYFLELEGFTVLTAENGLLGLEMAFLERPDVIVSDVNMPGMGGLAMVKALRGDARTSQVRILMLTSESSVESESEGLAAGADDYILKPVEPRRLAARVRALLARSRPSAA
ncbi:MAG TPA: response regulator, partial [Vicinamibacterales bacterium]|nr:response regulator [Vicinamibacterales bacterium]